MQVTSVEVRKGDLDRQLAAAKEDSNIDLHPNIVELYAKKVTELQTLLSDENTRPQAMDIIRSMIDHIEIGDSGTRGNPDVILVGALAQILAYTQTNKTAASSGSDGRVLMVAGVGFEPTTFRL